MAIEVYLVDGMLAGVAAMALLLVIILGWRWRVMDSAGWALLAFGLGVALASSAVALGTLYADETSHPSAARAAAALGLGLSMAGVARWIPDLGHKRHATEAQRVRIAELEKDLQARAGEIHELEQALDAEQEHRERAEAANASTIDQWRSIVQHAPSLILTVDAQGRVLFANKPLPLLQGQRHALGVTLEQVTPGEAWPTAKAALKAAFDRGLASSYEFVLPGKEGPQEFAAVIGPVKRDEGVVAATIIATDVTQLKRAEAAKREAAEKAARVAQLEEMNSFKTQLIDTAAHELSNPLMPIKLQFALLRHAGLEGLPEKQRGMLDIIERNVQRLTVLIQDMRDLTRVQNNKLRLQPEPMDIAENISEAVQSFQEPAKQAGIVLEGRTPEHLDLIADGQRVTQVLFNLISNAVKFTPQGGAVMVEAAEEGGFATIRVKDTGKGLTPEQIGKLFQPFSQVHQPGEVKERGTGLGLYICKGIVEQHGGRIWVESEGPGAGSTFAFTLPLPKPGEIVYEDEPQPEAPGAAAP